MCEYCGRDGKCIVCGGGNSPATLAVTIRQLRVKIMRAEEQTRRDREDLARLLAEAGRRPGDGADQPELFQSAAQAKLF